MFDIGWSELIVIAVIAIIVVGPKDLPKLLRNIGHYAGKLRRAAGDFQRQFEDAIRESDVEEVRKAIESAKVEAPRLDQPVMLPKTEATAQAEATPKPQRKRTPAKPKAAAKRGKKPAEPAR